MAATRKSPARKTASGKSAGKTSARKAPARAETPDRDSHGRFKPDHHVRNAAVGATAFLATAAAGLAAAFRFGLLDRFLPQTEGHSAEDLLIDERPRDRAPAAFRPDIDAPMTKAEREALRPPVGKPSLVD